MLRPNPEPEPIDLPQTVNDAIDFCKKIQEPDGLLMLNVIYRRFGIVEFAGALQRYDEIMQYEEPVMRVFRRIADYDNPIQANDLAGVSIDKDQLTTRALYCDRFGLPYNYPGALVRAASAGDYMLTHALLAWIWIQENNYELPLPENFITELYNANAELINDDSVVTDLELEAAAFLNLAGQGHLVDSRFVERVASAQNYDGGWLLSSDTSGPSYWHASVLGLLFLLHIEYPSETYPQMLAPPSQ